MAATAAAPAPTAPAGPTPTPADDGDYRIGEALAVGVACALGTVAVGVLAYWVLAGLIDTVSPWRAAVGKEIHDLGTIFFWL